MTQRKCYKCEPPITQEDKTEGNYEIASTSGRVRHIRCPGKKAYWEEATDKQAADFAKDTSENKQYDATSWIVK